MSGEPGREYAGRVVAVAGDARGLGAVAAAAFAEEGAELAIGDRDREAGEMLREALAGKGWRARFFEVDVADHEEADGFAKAVFRAFGRCDVLVNATPLGPFSEALVVDPAEWRATVDRVLAAAFFCSQAFGKRMAESGSGSIVNLASLDAFHANPGRSAQAVAATGLVGLTRSLGIELARAGVRVNALAPGVIDRDNSLDPVVQDTLEARIPLGRLATDEEVAAALLFVAGPRADFMTTDVVRIDGGWAALNSFAPGLRFD